MEPLCSNSLNYYVLSFSFFLDEIERRFAEALKETAMPEKPATVVFPTIIALHEEEEGEEKDASKKKSKKRRICKETLPATPSSPTSLPLPIYFTSEGYFE